MELLVVCVFAYWLVKHLPEVASEVAQGIGYGLRGEESPGAKARRERFEEAGIDPASGGAFSQFAGNLLRDFWLDRDKARARRRQDREAVGGSGGDGRSWWQRWQDKFDENVDKYADRWKGRSDGHADPDDESSDDWRGSAGPDGDELGWKTTGGPDNPGDPGGGSRPGSDTNPGNWHTPHEDPDPATPPPPDPATDEPPRRPPIRVEATTSEPEPEGDTDWGPVDPVYAQHEVFGNCNPLTCPHPDHGRPTPAGTPNREPNTASEPARTATAVLELEQGETMSSTVATRGIPVTGVQSGAAECLSINRELETAIAEFRARLENIASRTHSMGDQTLGIVQFAGKSDVVVRMAQAAEAIAATKAQAVALGAEVSPLLTQTRTEFLRRA